MCKKMTPSMSWLFALPLGFVSTFAEEKILVYSPSDLIQAFYRLFGVYITLIPVS